MPPRLQRFFLRLLRYDLDLQFIPGKQLVLADMLSRATSRQAGDTDSDDVEVHADDTDGGCAFTCRGVTRKATANDAAGCPFRSRISGPKASPEQRLQEDPSAAGSRRHRSS
nr:uncharacterized protein LOC119167447 [Rhipicephalus microplus]XP_037281021.1 uncharacterized protein LOC119174285 [Rhipicephalus microplus]XP_037291292.1 uncharacterized protein LOC119187167 [Rhipicephalus microplus]XP_037291380.1 uncharacterized protein LOC119187317 [Rhipicephalus microplus]